MYNLVINLALIALGKVAADAPACNSNYRTRKEFRELLAANGQELNVEGQAFVNGVQCMANTERISGGSLWDDLARSHLDALNIHHGVASFLPWHRLYLLSAEKAMSDCTGESVSIPYWDTGLDSQAVEDSQIWYVVL
jgi:tyrosinase